MNKFMKAKSILIVVLSVALGGLAGWIAPHPFTAQPHAAAADRKALYYACPMHPTIKYDKPGDCPICGMKLQPVYADEPKTNTSAATPAGCCPSGQTL
jgi:hypothetical protein